MNGRCLCLAFAALEGEKMKEEWWERDAVGQDVSSTGGSTGCVANNRDGFINS